MAAIAPPASPNLRHTLSPTGEHPVTGDLLPRRRRTTPNRWLGADGLSIKTSFSPVAWSSPAGLTPRKFIFSRRATLPPENISPWIPSPVSFSSSRRIPPPPIPHLQPDPFVASPPVPSPPTGELLDSSRRWSGSSSPSVWFGRHGLDVNKKKGEGSISSEEEEKKRRRRREEGVLIKGVDSKPINAHPTIQNELI